MTTNISNNGYLDSLKWQQQTAAGKEKNDTLTQEDFFALLTRQLAYQDPSKPADNDQMIAQMTSFTMADGIANLNKNFESFASSMTSNSALQASTLVGKNALIPSQNLELNSSSGTQGAVKLDTAAHDMVVRIKDASGQTVRTLELGSNGSGTVKFAWDGKDQSGNMLPPGNYAFEAEGRVANGDYNSFPTMAFHNIASVSLKGAQGLVLNTGIGPISLSNVEEIGQG
jgi:flagellar basal-body rod modification protein FlgD